MPFVTILLDALTNTWGLLAGFLPTFILAVIVLLVGGILAFFAKRGVVWVCERLQINKGGAAIGLKEVLGRAGKYNLPAFFGWCVEWFIVVVAFVSALTIVEFSGVFAFFSTLGGYAIHVATAALILLVGVVVANFVSKLTRGSVKVARLVSANFLANVSWLALFIFTVLVALRELQVPEHIIGYVVLGAIAALALATGIALGIGKDGGFFGKLRRDIIE